MVTLNKAYRQAAAKAGIALPNGKFPIPDKAHLRAAIHYAHSSTVPFKTVEAHIRKRAAALHVKLPATFDLEEFAQGPGKKFGRSNSLKWPWLYDKLRAKGYDKSKAAAISNSRLGTRKHGRLNVLKADQAHDPKVLKKLAAADKKGKHSTRKQLISSADYIASFACHDKACAPPPAGVGGSKPGGAITFQIGNSAQNKTTS